MYAKMPAHLKKLINKAHLENRTCEQIVTHLEGELELKVLEAPDELKVNTVSQYATNKIADGPKPTCHHCKRSGPYKNQCRQLKRQKEQAEGTQHSSRNKNSFSWQVELSFEYFKKPLFILDDCRCKKFAENFIKTFLLPSF